MVRARTDWCGYSAPAILLQRRLRGFSQQGCTVGHPRRRGTERCGRRLLRRLWSRAALLLIACTLQDRREEACEPDCEVEGKCTICRIRRPDLRADLEIFFEHVAHGGGERAIRE